MESVRPKQGVAVALWVNAALLGGILLVLVARGEGRNFPTFLPAALGQNQAPIAGGAGVFVMPAQFSSNTWGCYLLDADAQTLCAYQYYPGDKQMRFIAARNFRFDRRLANYNTAPAPQEIEELVKKDQEAARGRNAPASPPPAGIPAAQP
jgi:hypothetical protein